MKRFIKNNNENYNNKDIIEIKPNTNILHPISAMVINTDNYDKPICLTKFYYKNNLEIESTKCADSTINKYNKYLYIPPIGLAYDDILEIYNISDINEMLDWFNNNFNNTNLHSINRILNCWIYKNFNILKNHNKILNEIYYKIIEKIFNTDKIKIDEIKIKEYIDYYLNYWINKYDNNIFNFNLLEYLLIYIKKKLKI